MMRIALDTNVLVYAEGFNDASRRDVARELLNKLPPDETCVPIQALGELFHVLTRKAKRSAHTARASILGWRDTFTLIDSSAQVMLAALDLAVDHQLVIWDALMLAAAAQANCRLLLSEDLQDGFTWRGVSVVNPFAPTPHPLLETALTSG